MSLEAPPSEPSEPLEPTEIELKLEYDDATWPSRQRLAARLAGEFALTWQRQVHLVDVYLDTPASDLLRRGFTFRVRGEDGRNQLTLKSLPRSGYRDDLMQRLEIEVDLSAEDDPLDPRRWPDALRQPLVTWIDSLGRLSPYLVVRQARDVHVVHATPLPADRSETAPLAELCLDHVVAHAVPDHLASRAGSRAKTRATGASLSPTSARSLAELAEPEPFLTFRLLELELLRGSDRGPFVRLVELLRQEAGAQPVRESKLERTLRSLSARRYDGARTQFEIGPEMSMAEAGRLMWHKQLAAMILTEAGARRGEDIEFVHDMRVATRRARSVLGLFGSHFRTKAIRPFQRSLRETAQRLGTVRDLDVALVKLRKYAKTRPPEEREALDEIAAYWRAERRDAYRALVLWLDSKAYRDFVAAFHAFCRTPGAGVRSAGEDDPTPPRTRVAHVMPSAILSRFEQVRAYDALLATGQANPPLAALHALRIDCKRLRYSLEPVQHLLGAEGAELVAQLKELQDLLGDLHDAFVAGQRLRALAESGLASPALEAYAEHQKVTLDELAQRVPEAWQSFVGAENRRRLALAVARL